MDFQDFPMILGNLGVETDHPPKMCAGLPGAPLAHPVEGLSGRRLRRTSPRSRRRRRTRRGSRPARTWQRYPVENSEGAKSVPRGVLKSRLHIIMQRVDVFNKFRILIETAVAWHYMPNPRKFEMSVVIVYLNPKTKSKPAS